jgi:hypothetical protein
MTQSSWPFENADTTETQYSYLFNKLKSSGVAGLPSNTELKVTGDSSGMNVKVAAGFAIVRGFMYWSDAQVTNTIGASSSNPRIDLVVLRLDPSANTIVQAVVAGTPAVTPSAPSLTQTTTAIYELEIGRVTVPALATVIAAGNVSDTRPCLGDDVGVWTTTQRPANPHDGQLGWSTTNQVLEVYNAAISAWEEATPNNIDAATITSGTLSSSRLGTVPITKISASGSSLAVGNIVAVNTDYTMIGTPAPQAMSTFYNNPTVGTTYTSTSASLGLIGSGQYQIMFTAHVTDTDSVNCQLSVRFTIGSTSWIYTGYIPAGFTGQVTATRYFGSTPSTLTTAKVDLKVSTGSRSIDTFINAIGIN